MHRANAACLSLTPPEELGSGKRPILPLLTPIPPHGIRIRVCVHGRQRHLWKKAQPRGKQTHSPLTVNKRKKMECLWKDYREDAFRARQEKSIVSIQAQQRLPPGKTSLFRAFRRSPARQAGRASGLSRTRRCLHGVDLPVLKCQICHTHRETVSSLRILYRMKYF